MASNMTHPSRSRNIKTLGLVIKTSIFDEHGKIVTLITPNLGKISVFARSARKLTSPMIGKLELLNICEFELYKSTKQSLTITQCEIREYFPHIKQSISLIEKACQIAKMTYEHISDNEHPESSEELFMLLVDSLTQLNNFKDPDLTLETYRLKLFDFLGLLPSFTHCSACHTHLEESDFEKGQNIFHLFCQNCHTSKHQHGRIEIKAIKLMKFLRETSYADIYKIRINQDEKKLLHSSTEALFLSHPSSSFSSFTTFNTPFTFSIADNTFSS